MAQTYSDISSAEHETGNTTFLSSYDHKGEKVGQGDEETDDSRYQGSLSQAIQAGALAVSSEASIDSEDGLQEKRGQVQVEHLFGQKVKNQREQE